MALYAQQFSQVFDKATEQGIEVKEFQTLFLWGPPIETRIRGGRFHCNHLSLVAVD